MGLVFAPGATTYVEQNTAVAALVPQLQALGEKVQVMPIGVKANAIERVANGNGGRWVGAADPRSEGVAMDEAGQMTQIRRIDRVHEAPAE